ncbi:MAG: M43 family zinc metalloprotease [Bacteroidia bacterium]
MKKLTIVFKRFAFALAGICVFSAGAQTNHNWCGFTSDAQLIQKIRALPPSVQSPAGSVAPIKCLNRTLSVAIHIVTDSLNNPNITQAQINKGLDTLNHDFAPICLKFKICSQDTIYNYKYYSFDKALETGEVHSIYEVHNVINVYIVGEVVNPGVSGFAGTGGDYAVLSHSCVTDFKCWSHEFGHFFSLMHTFDTAPGAELVNGSNCSTAGDLICDTPADIDPAPINSGSCSWYGSNQDANGDYYTPIIGNIMSYHPAACKTGFTVGQFNQMVNYYLASRTYLY